MPSKPFLRSGVKPGGLPAAFAAVPGIEQVGETVVDEARDRQQHGIAEEGCQPTLAGRRAPDCDRDIGADEQPSRRIGGVQPAPDVLQPRAVAGECGRVEIDVSKFDPAGLDRLDEQLLLMPDAGVVRQGTACCTRRSVQS